MQHTKLSGQLEGSKTQVWVVLIANLIFSVIHKKIKEAKQFTILVVMAKGNLVSYVCFSDNTTNQISQRRTAESENSTTGYFRNCAGEYF